MTTSTEPEIEKLREFRREVQAEMNEGKKAAPLFSGNVALVRVRSECQIHPVIAQIWRTRLPRYIVIVANEGYVPDRIHFSARSAPGTSVLDFLRNIELTEGEDTYGHGHDQASGGNLSFSRWNELLGVLGFPARTFAPESATITRT